MAVKKHNTGGHEHEWALTFAVLAVIAIAMSAFMRDKHETTRSDVKAMMVSADVSRIDCDCKMCRYLKAKGDIR